MSQDLIVASLKEAQVCLASVLADGAFVETLHAVSCLMADTLSSGGKILVAGNGGSLADAMHFAEECTGRFRKNRTPYPVLALSDPTHLTCVANDYGYEHVFSRMVEAFGRPGDLVLLLTTSGKSRNLMLAAESAHEAGAQVVALVGRDGGLLAPVCDTVIFAPGDTSDRIQEIHMLALHILVEAIESRLGHS